MGDSSSARNWTSGDDPQFDADLELATRLSLETYEHEKRRRSTLPDQSFLSHQNSAKWSRTNSCSAGGDRSVVDNVNSMASVTPTGIIPPPPSSSIKRHRSLPYRVRGQSQDDPTPSSESSASTPVAAQPFTTYNSNNNNGTTDHSRHGATLQINDDLISLASPQLTKRHTSDIFGALVASPQNGNSNGNSAVTSPISASVYPRAISQGPLMYPNLSANPLPGPSIGFNVHPPSALPIATVNFNTNTWQANFSPSPQPKFPTPQFTSPPPIQTNNGNKLPQAMKPLPAEDLIDLGVFDSQKILHLFDPLLSPEQVPSRPVSSPSTQPDRSSHSSESTSSSGVVSVASAVVPAIRTSLYPNLDDAVKAGTLSAGGLFPPSVTPRSESPYGLLHKELMDFDESSSIYDAYNPLEYLFAVSCSSGSSTIASEFYYATNSTYNDALRESTSRGGSSPDGASGVDRSIGFSHYYPDSVASFDPVPPALPPRNNEQNVPVAAPRKNKSHKEPEVQRRVRNSTSDKGKRAAKLYENLESVKEQSMFDSEIQAFYEMLRKIRLSCRHVDSTTNRGYIFSTTFPTKSLGEGFTIKVRVWNESFTKDPVVFVCDVSAMVEHVLEQSLVLLEIQGSGRDFILRVHGFNEYLRPGVPMSDFRHVHECIKLDQDVKLVLVQKSSLDRKKWSRTPRDDSQCIEMDIDTILPTQPPKSITHADISRFLEVIDRESDKIREKLNLKWATTRRRDSSSALLNTAPLIQPVKGVCVLLGDIQTVDIRNSLDLFSRACDEWNSKVKVSSPIDPSPEPRRRLRIGSDVSSRYSVVDLDASGSSNGASIPECSFFEDGSRDFVINALEQVEESVRILVEMYSRSFPVSFRMKSDISATSFRKRQGCRSTADLSETFLLRIGAVHRLSPEWLTTYLDYFLGVEMYHGSTMLVKTTTTYLAPSKSDNNLFFTTLVYDSWVDFEHLPLCILPRECRLVFTLFGRKKSQDEKNETGMETDELGWASIQCFNFKGQLVQGNYILPFWPQGLEQKRLGPAPNPTTASDQNASLITIEFTDCEEDIHFPEIPSTVPFFRDFASLDCNTQQMLNHIIDNCTFAKFPADEREIFWEKRHYLNQYPNALPKVLLSARLWDYASLAEIHAMLRHWEPMEPIDALQLLLPCFPDSKVREQAIAWISQMDDEELENMLPQLIEALSYETFDFSPLAEFLLKKSLSCLKISHAMFWLLASQVGLGKWVNDFHEGVSIVSTVPKETSEIIFDPKRRRLELMLNSLMVSCGSQWKAALVAEYRMIEIFSDIASQVKNAPSSNRNEVLTHELHKIDICGLNGSKSFPLPLSPSYDVMHIDVNSCHSFSSASVPLKITFLNALPEGGPVPMLFKKGDDLRQDMLTIQIIRVIEKWWLKEGLDFRVLTFSCVPTGHKEGVVEMVPNSETLCKIQSEYGVTGAFQDRPIADWLAKMNPNTVDYKRAVENFTVTCSAYCVLTYVLGICDRHNDNIMLTSNGHLFHIDFGKFLGDAQRFGTFKRDRTPFVLTSDMVYVINDGEKSSDKFHRFVDLCCQAFRIVRQNGNVLVNLFALMATAGIPGVDLKSVSYIQNALLPHCSNAEAAARFTRFIEDSLRNWFTPVNFFIHSLGQFKFLSEAQDNPTMLSFVQKTYSIEEDGRIISAVIKDCKKRYNPEKYYSYVIEARRETLPDSFFLNRSYKEFLELYSKLCINFPMIVSSLKNLPKGPGLGRSNVKPVADKRKVQLQMFLDSLFKLAPEVSHSTLVYTFFHPLLRDEEVDEDSDSALSPSKGIKPSTHRIHGKIKIGLEYVRSALSVLIQHAVDLACPNGQPPSPYVKTYLVPDVSRLTKRKTRVVRKSQFPTFMEMIEYRLPLHILQQKTLQVSVWHYDPLQENNFLGGVAIPLTTLTANKEVVGTYALGNINTTT